jgi:polyferredoxin
MLTAFTWTISHRIPLGLDIIRDRNRLYRELWDGSVENVYTLTIMNRESADRTYQLSATGGFGVDLVTRFEDDRIDVSAGEQVHIPVQLRTGPNAGGNQSVRFTVESIDTPLFSVTETSRFVSPKPSTEPSQ